jgi:hypothetical protein
MIDYDKPWGWVENKQPRISNSIAPLGGGGGGDHGGGVVHVGPSQEDQMVGAVGGALAREGVDSMIQGLSGPGADLTATAAAKMVGEGASSAAGSQAAMLAEQMAGMGSAGAQATGQALGAASSGASALGPLGAAAGGLMEGEYDKAAGAALGSVIGAYFGPIGSMVGGQLGGYAGNAVGSMFGFAEGTTSVGDKAAATPAVPQNMVISPDQISSVIQAGGKGAGGAAPYVKPQVTGKYYGELNQAYDPAAVGRAKVFAQQNPQGGKGAGPATPSPTPVVPGSGTNPNPSDRPEVLGPDPLGPYDPTWTWTNSGGENPYEGHWTKNPVDDQGNIKTQPGPLEEFDPNWHFTPSGGENPYEGFWQWIDPNPDPYAIPYNPNQV